MKIRRPTPRQLMLASVPLSLCLIALIWWWLPSVSQQDVDSLNTQITEVHRVEDGLYGVWLRSGNLSLVERSALRSALQLPADPHASLPPYGGTLQVSGKGNRYALQISKIPKEACQYLGLSAPTGFLSLQPIASPRQFDRLESYFEESADAPNVRTATDLVDGKGVGTLTINRTLRTDARSVSSLCRKLDNTLLWTLVFPDENAALLEKMGLSKSFEAE